MLDSTTVTQSTDALSGITGNLGTIVILGTLLSVVFVALYIASFIRKRRIEKGTLQMQKDVHELLEIERIKIDSPASSSNQDIVL